MRGSELFANRSSICCNLLLRSRLLLLRVRIFNHPPVLTSISRQATQRDPHGGEGGKFVLLVRAELGLEPSFHVTYKLHPTDQS